MKGVAIGPQRPVERPLERLAARILEHQHNPIDESQLISYGAFARLSVRELIFRAGRGELKNGASRFTHIRPQPAPMGIDDGPADRQPHPHPAGLRCVESLKNALDMLRIDAPPG